MSSDEYSDDDDDVSESTRIMPPVRFLKLTSYLDLLRDAAFTPAQMWLGTPPKLTMVMGNPSADLDSFVSAAILSYFHNSGVRGGSPMYGVRKKFDREDPSRKLYLSLINMPKVESRSDLQRLRPEFGVALREAFRIGERDERDRKWAVEEPEDVEKVMCTKLLTVRDLVKYDSMFESFKARFQPPRAEDRDKLPEDKQPIILVDHNVPSIPSLASDDISKRLSVTGCIDHHIDEKYIPEASHIKPRIIRTGIGSCTTLVVSYLRESGLWPEVTSEDLDEDDIAALRSMSTLALAPILIDTSNLKATGEKCSDLDREVVSFLESQINPPSLAANKASKSSHWSRNEFYKQISEAKTNALDRLTMSEIFDRDYKQWDDDEIRIGISSIVKPISWLLEKRCKGDPSTFVSEMQQFANDDSRNLGIFAFSTRGVKNKAKELGAFAFSKEGIKAIETFEKKAKEELGLEDWDGDNELRKQLEQAFGGSSKWRLWWMTDVTKTRKQVAPLMRDAVKSSVS